MSNNDFDIEELGAHIKHEKKKKKDKKQKERKRSYDSAEILNENAADLENLDESELAKRMAQLTGIAGQEEEEIEDQIDTGGNQG